MSVLHSVVSHSNFTYIPFLVINMLSLTLIRIISANNFLNYIIATVNLNIPFFVYRVLNLKLLIHCGFNFELEVHVAS